MQVASGKGRPSLVLISEPSQKACKHFSLRFLSKVGIKLALLHFKLTHHLSMPINFTCAIWWPLISRRIHAVHKLVYNSFNENNEPNIGRRCEIAPYRSCILYNKHGKVGDSAQKRSSFLCDHIRTLLSKSPVNLNCLTLTQSSNNSWQKLRPQMKQCCNQHH